MMELYCCQEHVDMALDEVVYECETYPVLTFISEENSYQQPVNIVETWQYI